MRISAVSEGDGIDTIIGDRETGPVLELRGLNAWYGSSQVAFDVNLTVRHGEVVGLLGRNGAGKTSALLAIAGSPLLLVRARAIELSGRDLSHLPSFRRVRAGVGLVLSGSRAFSDLTVHENLVMVRGRGARDAEWTIEAVYDRLPLLWKLRASKGGQLSGGERQLLAVARALVANPAVLLLDEPSEGLAPLIVRQLALILKELTQRGLAVLVTEQNHRLALEMAQRVYFMEKGKLVWEGCVPIAEEQEVIGRYLGV